MATIPLNENHILGSFIQHDCINEPRQLKLLTLTGDYVKETDNSV